MNPTASRTGAVDGAWWPRCDDLAAELPDLLAVLSARLGPVDRVLYRLSEWDYVPRRLRTAAVTVKLDGYERQPISTISLLGRGFRQVDLLVVAAYTEASDAHATMVRAASPSDTTGVDGLLGIQPGVRATLNQASVTRRHWESGRHAPATTGTSSNALSATVFEERSAAETSRDESSP